MRFKTLMVLTLTAVLTTVIHNNNVSDVSLPVSHQNISANAPQEIKLQKLLETVAVEQTIKEPKLNKKASRSKRTNLPSPKISSAQNYAQAYMEEKYGWGQNHFECLVSLWNRESGWRYNADNPTSSAYGIPQALPGSKMSSAGADWETNPKTQIRWGLNYIDKRYNTPCGAWKAFKKKGWY